MMKYTILFSVLSLFFLASCESGLVYHHKATIEDGVWSYSDILDYQIDVKDTSDYYELFVKIIHSPEFSYENLYTKITTEFPDGNKLSDVVSFQLANKMGLWLGKCNSKKCVNELILQDRFRFKETGKHILYLENYSREELNGIMALELKLYNIDQM